MDIPEEAYKAALEIAVERVVMFGTKLKEKAQQKQEAERILKEAEVWPLSRCASVLPFVGTDKNNDHHSSLNDDGRLQFRLAVIWLAPFPAHYVSVDFQCRILVPNDPISIHLPTHDIRVNCRYVEYTIRNHKVVDTLPDGKIEYLDGIKAVDLDLRPNSPVTTEELGPKSASADQTKLGRYIEILGLRITAHAPWKKVRDSEYLPNFSIWVPRY